jgi:quinol monooxygenase YgiN
MGDHVSWSLEVAVKAGQLDEFKAVLAEMVESTRAESGALIYEWSIGDDSATAHAYERYADSTALLAHLATFGQKFAQRLLGAVDVTRFVVYGTPNAEAREGLSAFGPSYMAPLDGFAR